LTSVLKLGGESVWIPELSNVVFYLVVKDLVAACIRVDPAVQGTTTTCAHWHSRPLVEGRNHGWDPSLDRSICARRWDYCTWIWLC